MIMLGTCSDIRQVLAPKHSAPVQICRGFILSVRSPRAVAWPGFQVQERDGELVVTSGDFRAVYYKPSDHPQLVLRSRTLTDDHALLARSWQAANDKARELGWIV
jgi:hypothetical protein